MIYLGKNEIRYSNNLNPDSKEYLEIKVDSIVPYFNEIVEIEDGFTFKDFFDIIEKDKEIINVIFSSFLGHFPLYPYLDELKKDCLPESKEDMKYIECIWVAEQFDYNVFYEKHKDDKDGIMFELNDGKLRKPSKNDGNDVNIYIDITGVGDDPDGGNIYYGIDFTPLYRIKHLPIKLNTDFKMKDVNKYGEGEKNVVEGKREFSVFDIVSAILSEISFAGLPEDRDDKIQNAIDMAEGMKEDEEDDERE